MEVIVRTFVALELQHTGCCCGILVITLFSQKKNCNAVVFSLVLFLSYDLISDSDTHTNTPPPKNLNKLQKEFKIESF